MLLNSVNETPAQYWCATSLQTEQVTADKLSESVETGTAVAQSVNEGSVVAWEL